jgi:hypothetical protein
MTTTMVHVRWMVRRDLPGVMAVESATGGVWAEEKFLESLRRRNCVGMVSEPMRGRDQPLTGFMVYELHRDRLKVLNFGATTDDVAEALFAKLLYKLCSHRREGLDVAALVRPEWMTGDVRALLAAPKPPYLPILADALEDAGCSERWLLDGLRSVLTASSE